MLPQRRLKEYKLEFNLFGQHAFIKKFGRTITMKLFNQWFEVGTTARRKWNDVFFKKRPYYSHFVWGKLSVIYGQPHLEPVQVHSGCLAEVLNKGRDGISYCTGCETVVEGETDYITMEEFESLA